MPVVSFDAWIQLEGALGLLDEVMKLEELPAPLAARIHERLCTMRPIVRELSWHFQSPVHPALLEHVRARGNTANQAMIAIRQRRQFMSCEWCGQRKPDPDSRRVNTCCACRENLGAKVREIEEAS